MMSDRPIMALVHEKTPLMCRLLLPSYKESVLRTESALAKGKRRHPGKIAMQRLPGIFCSSFEVHGNEPPWCCMTNCAPSSRNRARL